MTCLSLLNYAEAKRVFDRGNKDELKAWSGQPVMEQVEKTTMALMEEELGIVKEN